MKRVFNSVSAALISMFAAAQEASLLKLDIEARVDYSQEYQTGAKLNEASGFKGRYLNIRLDGNLTDKVSYSYRQRLNKPNKDASFFDATDWITLN